MRNKFKIYELVRFNKNIGMVIDKDNTKKSYYIEFFDNKLEWIEEMNLMRVFEKEQYNTRICNIKLVISRNGYMILKKYMTHKLDKNNKFNELKKLKSQKVNNNEYVILAKNNIIWPRKNKSVIVLEELLKEFLIKKIPFSYIRVNLKDIEDVYILKYIQDKNVDILEIEQNIRIKRKV